MVSKATSLIPAGYSFFSSDILISDKGLEILQDLLSQARNRNPDDFDMYIYNDFYCYALLDLVDKMLLSAHTKITKKDYDDTFTLLEVLTYFFDCEPAWPMCDDDQRTKHTDSAYGALLVTLLKALEQESRLDNTHFPTLEYVLKKASRWGDSMHGLGCELNYHLVCKKMGENLFKDKSADEISLEKARLEEWLKTLPEEKREQMKEEIDDDTEETRTEGPWYCHGEDISSRIILSRVWKEYKDYMATVPTKPLRGPGTWDISTWSDADRKKYAFDDY